MKNKIVFLFILFATVFSSFYTSTAQPLSEFWGVSSTGGAYNGGVIFKTGNDGSNPVVKYNFNNPDGYNPLYSGLCKASSGKLYGLAYSGGDFDFGVLFEYDPTSDTIINKINFDSSGFGSNPAASLIELQNGMLYGTTMNGGTFDLGVLFKYDPVTNNLIVLENFDGNLSGSRPATTLFKAGNGKLYGVTSEGGANNCGTLFCLDPASVIFTKLADFNGTNGNKPLGNLIQAQNGNLFGTTTIGGVNGKGVLFEYDTLIGMIAARQDFDGSYKGSNPYSLIMGGNGKIYGITMTGGTYDMGVLFEYAPLLNNLNRIFDFNGSINGSYPTGMLCNANNKIFGTTSGGGSSGFGTIFKYDIPGDTLITVAILDSALSGQNPFGGPAFGSNGKIYGMTNRGGEEDLGVIYELDTATSTCINKKTFHRHMQGFNPNGKIVLGPNGMLYGVSSWGGQFSKGALYTYDRTTDTYTLLFSFTGSAQGTNPTGNLFFASNGKLYGTTLRGGIYDMGVLFEYDPGTQHCNKKFDFGAPDYGSFPIGDLIEVQPGFIYGTTLMGGINDMGTIYIYYVPLDTCFNLSDFDGPGHGSMPYAGLCQASNGKCYGLTNTGGVNDEGVIFEFNTSTFVITKLFDFDHSTSGANPYGQFTLAGNGKLYATAQTGGSQSYGTLFEFDPSTNAFTKKFDFDGALHGAGPSSTLLAAINNKLYGTTQQGGAQNKGVLFEYDPATNIMSKKFDFTGANGKELFLCRLSEICNNATIVIQPSNQAVCAGAGQIFTIEASGNGLTYQWQADTGTGFFNVYDNNFLSGATNDTLHLTNVPLELNNCIFRCIVSSSCPLMILNSQSAGLTVHFTAVDLTGLDSVYCLYDPPDPLSENPPGGLITGNGMIGNSFNPMVAGTGTWTITYCYTDGYGCTFCDTDTTLVDLSCRVTPVIAEGDIQLYPNPNEGVFTIDLPSKEANEIRIYNGLGDIVFTTIISNASAFQFDHKLDRGVYQVEVKNSLQVKKFHLIIN